MAHKCSQQVLAAPTVSPSPSLSKDVGEILPFSCKSFALRPGVGNTKSTIVVSLLARRQKM